MNTKLNFHYLLVVLTIATILLTACGNVHIPEVSAADKQARLAEYSNYMSQDGSVEGDPGKGQNMYSQMCKDCHGEDGRDENFAEGGLAKYLGTSADEDGLAFFEITNFGDGERKMPGFYDDLTLEQLIDIQAYAQTLPTE